jgi:hypothetical protein
MRAGTERRAEVGICKARTRNGVFCHAHAGVYLSIN